MKCPTMEVDRNGQKVVINTCDFDAETMNEWGESTPETPAPEAPAPEAPKTTNRRTRKTKT